MTPFLGTIDVVTVPVHPNVRDAACASDDTISTDSSRDVCDPVSKLPLVHARIYLVPVLAPMAWLRQLGDIRCTQAECGCGATLCVKIYANRQTIGFLHPPHLPNVSIFRLSGGPSVHLRGSIHGIS